MAKKGSILIVALVVALAGLFAWILFFQPDPPERAPESSSRLSEAKTSTPKGIYSRVHFDVDPPCTDTAPAGCMVFVPGGAFLMGAQNKDPEALGYDHDARGDEAPTHRVEVREFWIHKEEVKAVQYEKCVAANACELTGVSTAAGYYNWGQKERSEHPLNGVTWSAARAYCAYLGGRLPTEAEWEYAARGDDIRRYPWGDQAPDCNKTKLSSKKCGIDGTSGRPMPRSASPFFVEDMAGSLWEWTADWYGEDAYAKSPTQSPTGPEHGIRKVIRGGGWMDEDFNDLRATARAALSPDTQMSDLGFRCVRANPE